MKATASLQTLACHAWERRRRWDVLRSKYTQGNAMKATASLKSLDHLAMKGRSRSSEPQVHQFSAKSLRGSVDAAISL